MAVTKALDPNGVSAEKQRLVGQQATLASGISGWTAFGDPNGLRDQQMKQVENDFRLNITSASRANKSEFDSAFAYCGFGLEQVSTS